MTPGATKYPLGLGPFGNFLVFLMFAGAAGYFANAALAGDVAAIVVLGRVIAGPDGNWHLMIALAVLFGLAGLYLLVRSLRNIGNEQYVLLDANRIELSGLEFDGGKRVVSHAEIKEVLDYSVQGVATVEIRLRDGSKLSLAAAQFRTTAQYRQFRADLGSRLPPILSRLGLAAMLLLSMGTPSALAAAENERTSIGAVRAQLYYQRSGVLSEDLIARKPRFNGWNTSEGEGDAREPSDYLLVSADLVNPGPEDYVSDKVTLRVTDEIGTELKVKEFSGLLVPGKGALHLPIWLEDAGCLGTVTVTATFRAQVVSGTLDLICGT